MQRKSSHRVARVAAMITLLVGCKEALAFLPNIELVSLLVALFAVHIGSDTLLAIYVFDLVQGLLYGFNPWWFVPYLYIWTLLYFAARLFRRMQDALGWAALLGIYGLVFGFLCALPYYVVGGLASGTSYFLAGLGYDILHAGGNFFVGLLLWKPLSGALSRIVKTES